ncbi:hypothetical protein [Rhodopirellula baltica]|uniref:Uncharacterized protein n=1 Tax=Rhodopirellula baltica SWK14 TaxID=993516 RepID=L7C6L4_RHOBT|nr:hypothetical protein [Rhodopirellula baltica]ELP29663.1 hypothetical protein RBSWK_06364 [Rhodopirellula baltica SWK14]
MSSLREVGGSADLDELSAKRIAGDEADFRVQASDLGEERDVRNAMVQGGSTTSAN